MSKKIFLFDELVGEPLPGVDPGDVQDDFIRDPGTASIPSP
ncbi:MAG: hypothetical protein ABFD70_00455 [Syntrophaceae bacterium]